MTMIMTLQDAIAELKLDKVNAFSAGSFEDDGWDAATAEAIATILNAAASGALIPRTDADLAGALVVQKAGEVCRAKYDNDIGEWVSGWNSAIDVCADTILALADPDALAEVAALKAEIAELKSCRDYGPRMDEKRQAAIMELALGSDRIDLMEAKQAAEAEVARLQKQIDARDKELDYLNRRYIREIERNHELLSDVLRMEEALTAARRVVYQSSIDRTQPEEADAALRLIDAALTTPEKDDMP